MAGTMHKMAVYLGLVEDDPRYDEGYDSYEEYEDEYGEPAEAAEPAEAERPVPRARLPLFAACAREPHLVAAIRQRPGYPAARSGRQ